MTRRGETLDERPIDEFLMLGEGDQAAALEWLAPIIDGGRRRARKADDVEPFNRTVGLVVANALVSGGQGVHYSRRPEAYSGASPYKPSWLGSKHLLGVIDGLAREGLLGLSKGRWDGPFSKGLRSSFKSTPNLVEGLGARGIEFPTVQRDRASAPVIELKDENKRRIPYDARDPWVARRIAELRAYNAFIEGRDISLQGRQSPSFCSLTRIFNDGSWERGGRHYRGWWQNVPSTQRPGILIDGEEAVELDFGGFNTRALYHLSGQDYPGDPYDVPEVKSLFEEVGMDWLKEGRPIVKDVVNILLNVSSRNAIYKMKEQFPDQRVPLKSIIPLMLKHHAPIGDQFLKVVAPRLMNLESDICNDVILRGMSEGVVILPIFDSFIASKKHLDFLTNLMASSYKGRLGFDPTIH